MTPKPEIEYVNVVGNRLLLPVLGRARELATPVCVCLYIIDTHTILMLMGAAGFQ